MVAYLTRGEGWETVWRELADVSTALCAPHVVDAEVGHVLRRLTLRRELVPEAATAALGDLAAMPLTRTGHVPLLERAWSLRKTVFFYDALYIALAELLEMPLLTLDARLGRLRETTAEVRVIG